MTTSPSTATTYKNSNHSLMWRWRRAAALSAALMLVFGMVMTAGAAASSARETSVEDIFRAKLNHARDARGIPRLESRPALVAVAREQARRMAARSVLYHNPRLTTDVRNWRYVGENVGHGPDAWAVHRAFMRSPHHRANILDRDYTQMGIGVVVVNGRVWVSQVFRRPA